MTDYLALFPKCAMRERRPAIQEADRQFFFLDAQSITAEIFVHCVGIYYNVLFM